MQPVCFLNNVEKYDGLMKPRKLDISVTVIVVLRKCHFALLIIVIFLYSIGVYPVACLKFFMNRDFDKWHI